MQVGLAHTDRLTSFHPSRLQRGRPAPGLVTRRCHPSRFLPDLQNISVFLCAAASTRTRVSPSASPQRRDVSGSRTFHGAGSACLLFPTAAGRQRHLPLTFGELPRAVQLRLCGVWILGVLSIHRGSFRTTPYLLLLNHEPEQVAVRYQLW